MIRISLSWECHYRKKMLGLEEINKSKRPGLWESQAGIQVEKSAI